MPLVECFYYLGKDLDLGFLKKANYVQNAKQINIDKCSVTLHKYYTKSKQKIVVNYILHPSHI